MMNFLIAYFAIGLLITAYCCYLLYQHDRNTEWWVYMSCVSFVFLCWPAMIFILQGMNNDEYNF